jgi:hypothetical protein
MSDLSTEIISGIVGAVAGGFSGAAVGWLIAPTQAEREERGKSRLEGRKQIASAISNLNYQMVEARGKLFRIESVGELLDRARFVEFAGAIRQGATFLPRIERWRVERETRNLVGRLAWRLAEIVPPEHYSDIDEASLVKATADTRTSTDSPLCGPTLVNVRPTDAQWDATLKAIEKIHKTYPG